MTTNSEAAISDRLARRLFEIGCMPFITAREISILSGSGSEVAIRNIINELLDEGYVDYIEHCSDGEGRFSRRFFIIGKGVRLLCERFNISVEQLNEYMPCSKAWLMVLRRRIDLVVIALRLASLVASIRPECVPIRVYFPRKGYPDATIFTNIGLTIGVMRHGDALRYRDFAYRFDTLRRQRTLPSLLLVVATDIFDKIRIVEALRKPRYADGIARSAALATERELMNLTEKTRVWWRPLQLTQPFGLSKVVGEAAPTRTAVEPLYRYAKCTLPVKPEMTTLSVALRRTLNDIFKWQLMTTSQLARLHGTSRPDEAVYVKRLREMALVESLPIGPRAGCHVIATRGLSLISYRDRVQIAPFLRRWDPMQSSDSRKNVIANLLREREHTFGVNDFISRLAAEHPGTIESANATTLRRSFRYYGKDGQISPDMAAFLRGPGGVQTVLLEYERRAASETDMVDKLMPWLHYYGAKAHQVHFPTEPALLFVLADAGRQARFEAFAREHMRRMRIDLPLALCNVESLSRDGTLIRSAIWTTPRDTASGHINPFI